MTIVWLGERETIKSLQFVLSSGRLAIKLAIMAPVFSSIQSTGSVSPRKSNSVSALINSPDPTTMFYGLGVINRCWLIDVGCPAVWVRWYCRKYFRAFSSSVARKFPKRAEELSIGLEVELWQVFHIWLFSGQRQGNIEVVVECGRIKWGQIGWHSGSDYYSGFAETTWRMDDNNWHYLQFIYG